MALRFYLDRIASMRVRFSSIPKSGKDMKKRKKWETLLILSAITLTIYNIFPTLFYYSKPLRSSITKEQASQISQEIVTRVNDLEKDAIEWLHSYSSNLKIKPLSIQTDPENTQQIIVKFSSETEAKQFRNYFSKAASLISFAPARLMLSSLETDPKTVRVQRALSIHLDPKETEDLFSFSDKKSEEDQFSSLYKEVVFDRAATIVEALTNTSSIDQLAPAQDQDLIYSISNQINQFVELFKEDSPISYRFFSNFSKSGLIDPSLTTSSFIEQFNQANDRLKIQRINLQKKERALKKEGKFLDSFELQTLRSIERKENSIASAKAILKNNKNSLQIKGKTLDRSTILNTLERTFSPQKQTFSLNGLNPFIKEVVIDWSCDRITLVPFADLVTFKQNVSTAFEKDLFQQLMINEMARVTRLSDEQIISSDNAFYFQLSHLPNSRSLLCLNLDKIAEKQIGHITTTISTLWNPKHPELKRGDFPVVDVKAYQKLPVEQKSLCLAVLAPSSKETLFQGMKKGSIYILAKGVHRILEKYQQDTQSEQAHLFLQDFYALRDLLSQYGFIGYPAIHLMNAELADDYIFELDHFYAPILSATREEFHALGSKRFALLELTDVEQRILTQNKIETNIHEDLLKWNEDYQSAQTNMDETFKYFVPAPTKSLFLENMKLSLKKYFRGDERKVLHWGLDLSGGKTVTIELRDQQNKIVSNPSDLKQGMNELYNRVNKMGVSEVNIRMEGSHILLDFPGSQSLSAGELVKASSMHFHVVNEKFSPRNPEFGNLVDQFLQEVWNEAVVTNQKDTESLNAIARRHLYGNGTDTNAAQPRTQAAKVLYENGLRLPFLQDINANNHLNDSISKIALIRDKNPTKWFGQSHPLMIVFQNYALEGSNLTNIRASYDPSKGNFLSFEVKSHALSLDHQRYSPSSDLFNWTSQFAKEKIQGTKNEEYTHGQGWRMAVLLNDTVISAPTLDSPLKDSAMISGSFSQREAAQLVSDLKAGSLTFTPKILSEKNVSPELGKQDRAQGIIAMIIALLFVIVAMTFYYRFAGVIASIAVIFNLLIMWAALQNLQATLTLSSIAGIILTVGMAVDANVLVFERIKEEFSMSGSIASAIHAGYKKAFTAILDSNITTIMAALILLNFDSGPIKGFALTLIIGIASSMFTALFMTKFFFSIWLQNPKHTSLKMMDLLKSPRLNFLKNSKFIFMISSCIIVLGALFVPLQKNTLFGMDFTGGYALNIELKPSKETDYRAVLEKAFIANGANHQDFSIRTLSPSNHLRLLFSTSMQEKGKPFYHLDSSSEKVQWIASTIQTTGLNITNTDLDQNLSIVSGQMSDSMKNNAILSIGLALLAILFYIAIRFEWKYSISALICLIHDILIAIGILSILHALKVSVQIDLNTIAALMTIIGYSLNDTIIIFDRIREDLKHKKKISFPEVVNQALNDTLSRTLITSATTFLVLLALVLLGGNSIFGFALVMCVGVVFGTLSSLFIASPLMLFFHNLEKKKEKKISLVQKT